MDARLESHVCCGSKGPVSGFSERPHFRVIPACEFVPPTADNQPRLHNHATHRRIRARQPDGLFGQFQCLAHENRIVIHGRLSQLVIERFTKSLIFQPAAARATGESVCGLPPECEREFPQSRILRRGRVFARDGKQSRRQPSRHHR